MASGKRSKEIRRMARMARMATTVHAKGMVEVKGTNLVKTTATGTKYNTVTLAHPKGSFRNVLKLLKDRGGYDLFNPATNSHKFAEA